MTKRELPGLGTTLESWGLLHSGERSPKMYQPLPGFYPVTHTLWIGTNREGESRYNLRDQGQMRYFSRPGVPLSRHGSPTDQKPFPTVHTRPSPGGGISATLGRISAMKIIPMTHRTNYLPPPMKNLSLGVSRQVDNFNPHAFTKTGNTMGIDLKSPLRYRSPGQNGRPPTAY
jgi:hypothetical protein